jgi:hypothetical protein
VSSEELFSLAAPLIVERLGRALAAVPRGQLRESYLVDRVHQAPPTVLVKTLACAQREAVRGVVEARVLIETFTDISHGNKIEPGFAAGLVAVAVMFSEDSVVPLLSAPAANEDDRKGDKRKRNNSLADSGETLGRRKSLARTATGDMLLRILDDPHPEVIRNAMMNAYMTESLAVRVAARRPVPSLILDVVAKSKFGNRHAVRRALALNPDCPPKLACKIVSTMTENDLQDIAQTRDLLPEVRNAAKSLLER